MKNIEWKDKVASFKKIDVRGIAGNFLDGLKKQAAKLPVGEGIEVIQSFEPIPLYEIMEMPWQMKSIFIINAELLSYAELCRKTPIYCSFPNQRYFCRIIHNPA